MASPQKLACTLFPWIAMILCAALAALFWQSGLLRRWDDRLLLHYQELQPAAKELPMRLVTIQRTGDQTWPWSSLDYAILLNALGPFSPSVVALDLPLEDGDPLYPIYDIQLANQMARFPSVILSKTGLTAPPAPLQASAVIAGSRLLQSPAETMRKAPLAFLQETTWEPSFALQVAAAHLGADWSKSSIQPGSFIILRDPHQKVLLKIPVDTECRILIDQALFQSKITSTDFYSAIISAEDLRNGGTGTESFHEIRRNIILVGPEAPGTFREINSPSGPIPPVHLNHHLISQLLSARLCTEMNGFFYLLLLGSACLASGAFALIHSRLGSVSLLVLYLAAACVASYLCYDLGKIWWPPLPLILGTLLSWLSTRSLSLLNKQDESNQPELFPDL